jgi:hypothetical protein
MALLIIGMLGVGMLWLGLGAVVAVMVGRSFAERDAAELAQVEAVQDQAALAIARASSKTLPRRTPEPAPVRVTAQSGA